jgi:signal transduction histidine kinase
LRERGLLLGGQLTIESTPGRGTRIRAELPLVGDFDQDSAGGVQEYRP